jgi:NDP-sugar pyrophosphorylase family protein
MQAVIMAAGLGTRLRPHTLTTPKPMLPVAGRPILEWTIDGLPKEIDEVILVVGYLKERVIGHFGAEWRGRKMTYVEQKSLDGTGGAVAACEPLIKDRFVVLNGDDLYATEDIRAVLERGLAVAAQETGPQDRFGLLATDTEGRLTTIVEATSGVPKGGLVNVGMYGLDRRFFDYPLVPIKNGAEFGLPQTVATMTEDHPVAVVKTTFWLPIGYPEDLERASAAIAERTARS